jgi:hypothetical protein
MFPRGSVGWDMELALAKILNALCEQHGYGRVSQMAQCIEKLWREPGSIEEYRAVKALQMTPALAYDLGKKARREVHKLDPRFADWEIMRRTLGFFQFSKKNNFTQEHTDAFGRGFKGEPMK